MTSVELIIITAFVIAMLIAEANASWGVATFCLVVWLLVFHFWLQVDFLSMIHDHPWAFAVAIPVYLCCGFTWAIVKWKMMIVEYRQRRIENLKDYSKRSGQDDRYAAMVRGMEPLSASEHKHDLIRFWLYWPFSVLWYLIHDLVIDIGEWLYKFAARTFQRMADDDFKMSISNHVRDGDHSQTKGGGDDTARIS